jgi:hypothetical protein
VKSEKVSRSRALLSDKPQPLRDLSGIFFGRGRIKKAGDPDESSRVPRLPETTKLLQLSLRQPLDVHRFVITN